MRTDEDLRIAYNDLLDDDATDLIPIVGDLEIVLPVCQPPASLAIAFNRTLAEHTTVPRRKRRLFDMLVPDIYHPARRSIAIGLLVALTVSVLGGAAYAMGVLGGGSRPHVVESCSGFGAHWRLTGAGTRLMTPRQFVRAGGTLIPSWRHQAAGLQHPQYWVTPANADVVDTCRGSGTVQDKIGTNQRDRAQLLAISVVPMWKSNRPTMVGSLRIPGWGGCAPKPTDSPIRAPDGRPVAQLVEVPAGLARTVRVTFTPCSVSKRPVVTPRGQPPESHKVAFRILSQVFYQGSAGTVVVLAARPTPAAAHPGLSLGSSAGTLPDGTRVWDLHMSGCPTGSRGCSPLLDGWTNDIRWMKGGLIMSVSGDMSVMRLKVLAADVVLR